MITLNNEASQALESLAKLELNLVSDNLMDMYDAYIMLHEDDLDAQDITNKMFMIRYIVKVVGEIERKNLISKVEYATMRKVS